MYCVCGYTHTSVSAQTTANLLCVWIHTYQCFRTNNSKCIVCVDTHIPVYPQQEQIDCMYGYTRIECISNTNVEWIHMQSVYVCGYTCSAYPLGCHTHPLCIQGGCMWIHMKSLPSRDTHEELTLYVKLPHTPFVYTGCGYPWRAYPLGIHMKSLPSGLPHTPFVYTGWLGSKGSLKLKVIFSQRATNYRALLRKMTYKDKASYDSTPPYMSSMCGYTCVECISNVICYCMCAYNFITYINCTVSCMYVLYVCYVCPVCVHTNL